MNHLPGLETFPPGFSELVKKKISLPLLCSLRTFPESVRTLTSNLSEALNSLMPFVLSFLVSPLIHAFQPHCLHSSILYIFAELLLCARPCSGHREQDGVGGGHWWGGDWGF